MTATQDRPAAEIGKDRRRKEDQRLITGRTRWTDNITLPGMLHLAMVRSPFAHATITSIDTSEAEQAPNVVAVLKGSDFGEELKAYVLEDRHQIIGGLEARARSRASVARILDSL